MNLSLIIKAVDRATGPVRKIRAAVSGLAGSSGFGKLAGAARSAGAAIDRLGVRGRVSAGLKKIASDARAAAGRAGLGALDLAAKGARGSLLKLSSLAGRGVGFLAGGVGLLGGYLTGGVIGLASKFEQFQVVLENTEGSAAGARKAMAWVREFGKKTPYEVSEVMEAFVALKSYGIDPMGGALTSLGNASSGMSRSLMQAVEMMADAQTGEFERLKEFGIRAKVEGDKVTFSYMKNGRDMTRSAKKTGAEIQRAVLGIFDERFNGMMDRQSRTLSGLWSNIKDQIAGFQLDIADAGFFDFVKGKVQQLIDKLGALTKDGTIGRWAKSVSDWLEKAGAKVAKFIEGTDWAAVGSTMATLANATWKVAKAAAALINALSKVPSWAIAGGPFQIGAVVGTQAGTAVAGAARGASGHRGPVSRQPALPRAPGAGRPIRLGPPTAGRASRIMRAPRAEVGGRVDIRIRTDSGTSARVMGMKSANANVPLDVTRGRVGTG